MFCATQMFGLTLTEAVFALQFIHQLDILSSKLYIILIITVAAVFGYIFYLLRHYMQRLRRANWLPMLLLGLIVIPIDVSLNTPRNSNSGLASGAISPLNRRCRNPASSSWSINRTVIICWW